MSFWEMQKVFNINEQALKGCMFLVNFLEAEGNPIHDYEPVDCPQ